MKKIFFFCLFFILISFNSFAGSANINIIQESGFVVGYGDGRINGENRIYRPLLLIYHIGFDAHKLLPSVFTDSKGKLTFYLEPQFNPLLRPSDQYEVGIGFGAEYRFNITKNIDGYIMGGSGLHHISFGSQSQAEGFNFNDTLGFGLYIHISKRSAVNMGLRLRHISNGGIKKPNKGINNYFATLGYSIFFQ